VTGEQKHFRVWSLPDGALLADIPAEGFVSNLAFQDDRSLIVIVQYRALIQKWDVANKKLLHSFEIPRDVVFFTLSLDGKTMLVDYNDPGFERWDLASGKPQHYYRSALSASGWERLSGNDHFAVVWGYGIDGSGSGMSVWDLTNDTRVREFVTPLVGGDGWRAAALNADGSVLAASNDQGYVYFYGVASGQKLGQFQLPFTALSRLALPPGPAGALHPVTP
jgi:WD40 repeat protein